MEENEDITVAEMLLSENWEIINILIGANGFTRVKARRKAYQQGEANIVQKYAGTMYIRKLYYQKHKKDLSKFGVNENENI